MANWYYESMEVTRGPISGKQLLELVRKGDIVAGTPIRKDDSQWVPAAHVSGLLEAAGGESSSLICPFCRADIDRPPTRCRKCRREIDQLSDVALESPVEADADDVEPDTDSSAPADADSVAGDSARPKRQAWLSRIRKRPS